MAKKIVSKPSDAAEPAEIAPDQVQIDPSGSAKKNAKKDRSKTVRLTIDVPREVDFRLESIAAFKRKPKGAFAAELIDQRLQDFKADLSLRNVYAEIHGQAGEAA